MSVESATRAKTIEAGSVQACSLSFRSVSKRFGQILANDSVSFDVIGGGIHAIVGENGAGKSTLSKILYGYYKSDAGSINLDGHQIVLNSPFDARKLGIGMVHQQLALVSSLSGFENVVLGDPKLSFAFSKTKIEKQVQSKAREFGFKLDLSCPVSHLGIADRQKLEMFKLIWRDARVLILDEPTSQLTPFEAEELLSIARDLAESGRIVILITHHINEVINFARHITVLRQGRSISTVEASSVTSDALARLMIDIDMDSFLPIEGRAQSIAEPLINLKSVSTKATATSHPLHDISFGVRPAEIVGVAGISGSGQLEFGRLLAGLLEPSAGGISGSIINQGSEISRALALSVCYIPSEQNHACAPALSVAANCFLKSIDSLPVHTSTLWKLLNSVFINSAHMERHARAIIDAFSITPNLSDVPAAALSGGNLQRLIIGRELSTKTSVIVADNPCAGLDAAMSMRIRYELRKAALEGRAVILISPDLEELLTTCDRIVAMFNGRICGEQIAGQFDYQSLAACMGGKS
jgi:simple sugar transport system ATP-binding protein